MGKKKVEKKAKSQSASDIGRLGGRAVAKKRGKAYMREIGRRGAAARWKK